MFMLEVHLYPFHDTLKVLPHAVLLIIFFKREVTTGGLSVVLP